MPVAPSFADLLTQGQAEAQSRRPDLVFAEGDVTLALLHASGAMSDAVIRYGAQAFRETFLDGASGVALDTWVNDRYAIQRQAASSAQVTVTFTRTSGGAGGTIPAATRVATVVGADGSQIVYTTNGAIIVAAANNGPYSVACTAVQTGPAGNVAAAKVTVIVDTLFDATFAVTNAALAAGGNDQEPDEDLRERARAFYLSIRRGTLTALEYGAKLVPSVRVAVATENTTTGIVAVTVSDADGGSTVQMVADVVTELENWRAAGVAVTVTGGVARTVDLGIVIVARSTFAVAAAAALIVAAVQTRIRKLRAGETLYLDMVVAAVIAIAPDDIREVSFSSITVAGVPASVTADVVPTTGQVLRPGTITVA